MRFIHQAIPEVVLIEAEPFADVRGDFAELYRKSAFAAAGITADFVQANRSRSIARGTIRGLHMQIAPFAQAKLVRVVRGTIWDVAVDVRRGSPTYGAHVAAVLSAENGRALWLPGGFLHGFCTLTPGAEVNYLITREYAATVERGVRWNDPELALPWPLPARDVVLSARDRALPYLRDCPELATYGVRQCAVQF